jgi:hypothetical protein
MQVVAAVEGGQQPQRVGRVPEPLVEVDDAVEGALVRTQWLMASRSASSAAE